jgi:hypothetical protein
MDEDEFWRLVALLGGVADTTSCRALHAHVLETGQGAAFGEAVDQHVRRLLAACRVPFSHQGDTAEWIAAAVIATGRSTYDRAVRSGKELRPADWAWDDAEALLIVGFVDDGSHSGTDLPDPTGHASLQWNAQPVAEGVTTSWEPFVDQMTAMMGELDHPDWGRSVCNDLEWIAAIELAEADTGILDWSRNAGLHLALVVREVDQPENRRYPDHHQVMRVFPVAEVLTAPSRRDLYLRELRALAEWA